MPVWPQVDGNQHFNRPGPRLVEALEWLVGLLHDKWEITPQGEGYVGSWVALVAGCVCVCGCALGGGSSVGWSGCLREAVGAQAV